MHTGRSAPDDRAIVSADINSEPSFLYQNRKDKSVSHKQSERQNLDTLTAECIQEQDRCQQGAERGAEQHLEPARFKNCAKREHERENTTGRQDVRNTVVRESSEGGES